MEDSGHEIRIEDVDIWVTSEYYFYPSIFPSFISATKHISSKFLLFSPALATGISIPYPSISLHAIQRSPQPSLLLQILSSSGPQFDDHDPNGTISLTVIPTPSSAPQAQGQDPTAASAPSPPPSGEQSISPTTTVEQLFAALSACADLHPDPDSNSEIDINDDDAPIHSPNADNPYTEVDGLPPPMPGSGGWITAENVGEFFDEEGNFRGAGGLGEGAGRVRGREEDEGAEVVDGNGVEGGEAEAEEAKWRRTG